METDRKRTVGLVGIGLVGSALTENLLAAGYDVVGYDRDVERLGRFERQGGFPAGNGREVGRKAHTVILSLMTSEIVRQVVFDPDGLLSDDSQVRSIIDSTTCSPDDSIENWSRLHDRGVEYLDAPISGSSTQIRERDGVILVGGAEPVYRENVDLIRAVAAKHFYLGPAGSGTKAKLAVNLILGVNRMALAEGLLFAEGLGMDPESFLELLRTTPAYSRVMDLKGPKMIRGDFTTEGKVSQHHKDLGIILSIAHGMGQPLPLAAEHEKLLRLLIEAGQGQLDNSAVIDGLRRLRR